MYGNYKYIIVCHGMGGCCIQWMVIVGHGLYDKNVYLEENLKKKIFFFWKKYKSKKYTWKKILELFFYFSNKYFLKLFENIFLKISEKKWGKKGGKLKNILYPS